MNKELFVSSTPHETKVGLVEDDLLAEVYLERENEYTLAGSIYKGRVTRVLPGMQSAFVDIGLERDAFLYVSDFMELEEHDDDLTDVVPATRNVPDLRQQPAKTETADASQDSALATKPSYCPSATRERSKPKPSARDNPLPLRNPLKSPMAQTRRTVSAGAIVDGAAVVAGVAMAEEMAATGDRKEDRSEAPKDLPIGFQNALQSASRAQSSQHPRALWIPAEASPQVRRRDTSPCCFRASPFPNTSALRAAGTGSGVDPAACNRRSRVMRNSGRARCSSIAATFPEDEPIFAAAESVAEPLHEEHEDTQSVQEEPAEHLESASTSAEWKQEFRRPEEGATAVSRLATSPEKSTVTGWNMKRRG